MQPRTYQVPGISCDHCKNAIEEEVGKLAGVSEVVVDVDQRTVTVDGVASDTEIAAAVSEAGYELADAGPAAGGDGQTGPRSGDAPAPG